jgi:hypothetical protein
MLALQPSTLAEARSSHERGPRPRAKSVSYTRSVVVAALVLAFGFRPDESCNVWAGALPQANSKDQAAAAADSSGLVDLGRERLRKLEEEILGLGAQVLGSLEADKRPSIDDDAINQRITTQSAEFDHENAKLTHEVAEIAVVEYEQGIFKQDEAIVIGEIKLAESDVARARDSIGFAEGRLARIKQASRGTPEDLALEYAFEDKIVQASQREPGARLTLEKAQSKLDMLRKYVMPKRVKELRSEVEKARSDELAKQARWELEKSKLENLKEATKGQDRGSHEQRVLALLDRAVAIAEQLKTKLDQPEKDRASGEQLRKEIADLRGQLQALVEQAQAEHAAAKWAKLKPTVHAAAVRHLGAQAK